MYLYLSGGLKCSASAITRESSYTSYKANVVLRKLLGASYKRLGELNESLHVHWEKIYKFHATRMKGEPRGRWKKFLNLLWGSWEKASLPATNKYSETGYNKVISTKWLHKYIENDIFFKEKLQ